MILPIYLYGNPVLRRRAEEVDIKTLNIKQLASDMRDTLKVAEGCGLAAPQVGKSLRLFIVDGSELGEDFPDCVDFKQTFVNPEILETSEELVAYNEGCLSLPGISEKVLRPKTITIRYLDEDLVEHTETLTDFRARIFQHEYDHLEGHVFTDRVTPIRKQFLRTKLNSITKGKSIPDYKYKV